MFLKYYQESSFSLFYFEFFQRYQLLPNYHGYKIIYNIFLGIQLFIIIFFYLDGGRGGRRGDEEGEEEEEMTGKAFFFYFRCKNNCTRCQSISYNFRLRRRAFFFCVWQIDKFCFCIRTHSFFINSWGIKNSGISKSWCAPLSLKLPFNC